MGKKLSFFSARKFHYHLLTHVFSHDLNMLSLWVLSVVCDKVFELWYLQYMTRFIRTWINKIASFSDKFSYITLQTKLICMMNHVLGPVKFALIDFRNSLFFWLNWISQKRHTNMMQRTHYVHFETSLFEFSKQHLIKKEEPLLYQSTFFYLLQESTATRILSSPSEAAKEDNIEVWLKCYGTGRTHVHTDIRTERRVSWNIILDELFTQES